MLNNRLKEKLQECEVSLKKATKEDSVIFIGSFFSQYNQELVKEICDEEQRVIYCSPMEDLILEANEVPYIKYEIASEVGLLALIAKTLLEQNTNLNEATKECLDDFDVGYLSAESNVGEEEIDSIVNFINNSNKTIIIFGEDLYFHPDSKRIAQLSSILLNHKDLSFGLLDETQTEKEKTQDFLCEIDELESFDGSVVYFAPTSSEEENKKLFGSKQFAIAAKAKDKDTVFIKTKDENMTREFHISEQLKGTIALLPTKENRERYPYEKIKISTKK